MAFNIPNGDMDAFIEKLTASESSMAKQEPPPSHQHTIQSGVSASAYGLMASGSIIYEAIWIRPDDLELNDTNTTQTYAHDLTVATIPVDVALKLMAEHPILQQLIAIHNIEDNYAPTDKVSQGAGLDLAKSIRDAGHVWKAERVYPERSTLQDQQAIREHVRLTGSTPRGNSYRARLGLEPAPVNSNPRNASARAQRKAKRKRKP